MSDTNLYGPLVSNKQIENRIIGALTDWMPYYLGEMARLDGYAPGELIVPEGYVRASEFDKWPEDALPVLLVMAAATDKVRKGQDGEHEAGWTVGIAPVVKDQSAGASRDLAGTYAAAIRGAIVQHKRLRSTAYPDGIDGSVEWLGEAYTDLAFDSTRTLGTARVIFSVTINNAVTATGGPRELPTEPPDEDPGDWPGIASGYPHVLVKPVEVLP